MPIAKILLVDEAEEIRSLGAQCLAGTPEPEVRVVSSAEAGLSLAADLQPDLVLLDAQLPDLDTAGFLTELHRLVKNQPIVILLTEPNRTQRSMQSKSIGIGGRIAKPLDPEQLP